MPHVLAQVAFDHDSGLPEDLVVNTFHFDVVSTDPATGAVIVDNLVSFYGSATGQTASLVTRLSGVLAGTATVKCYDLSDPQPRTPFYTEVLNPFWTPSATVPYPSEVAVVLSFQGSKLSGLPQARRRGRIYFGPLVSSTGALLSGTVRPVAALQSDLGIAAKRLLTLCETGGFHWEVWSPTNGSGTYVKDGWVDNAFDTQRRRGERASSRTLWS